MKVPSHFPPPPPPPPPPPLLPSSSALLLLLPPPPLPPLLAPSRLTSSSPPSTHRLSSALKLTRPLRRGQEELQELFAGCGEVLGVRLAKAPKSNVRLAFVDFGTKTALLKAKKLKGTELRACLLVFAVLVAFAFAVVVVFVSFVSVFVCLSGFLRVHGRVRVPAIAALLSLHVHCLHSLDCARALQNNNNASPQTLRSKPYNPNSTQPAGSKLEIATAKNVVEKPGDGQASLAIRDSSRPKPAHCRYACA
eukprot:768759-Rhodomonas_salina.1